ncbi:MAG: alpha/beta fold hydrolase [Bacteroidota bacterium]
MTLDHLGITADDASRDLFERLLASAPYKTEVVVTQGVRTVFFGDGGEAEAAPKLELLESIAEDSPIAKHLEKRGPGLHHIAFEVADLGAEMERVRSLGIRLLSETPQPGADGKQIVFLHPKDTAGVLVELCMSPPPERRALTVAVDRREVIGWETGHEDGPVLLALHGALGTAEQMERFAPLWAKDFRVIALDLPGHGRSHDKRAMTWDRFAEGVEAVLDHLDLRDVRVFGYSLGAAVGLTVARRRPDLVSRLALHATNTQWTEVEVENMTADLREVPERVAARLKSLHGAEWREAVRRIVTFSESLPNAWISDAALAEVDHPALVSIGDRDGLFTTESALHLSRQLQDARLWVIPGVQHALSSLDAEAFARTIADHLL